MTAAGSEDVGSGKGNKRRATKGAICRPSRVRNGRNESMQPSGAGCVARYRHRPTESLTGARTLSGTRKTTTTSSSAIGCRGFANRAAHDLIRQPTAAWEAGSVAVLFGAHRPTRDGAEGAASTVRVLLCPRATPARHLVVSVTLRSPPFPVPRCRDELLHPPAVVPGRAGHCPAPSSCLSSRPGGRCAMDAQWTVLFTSWNPCGPKKFLTPPSSNSNSRSRERRVEGTRIRQPTDERCFICTTVVLSSVPPAPFGTRPSSAPKRACCIRAAIIMRRTRAGPALPL